MTDAPILSAGWADRLRELHALIPRMEDASDPDAQIRSVLRPILDRALGFVGQEFGQVAPDPLVCPNCDAAVSSDKSPYCSADCRELSAFIRQMRNSIASGTLFDLERQQGMGQALWNLQGGGFPRRQMMVTAKVIAKVIERDGGVCSVCGAPATEIDHTGSG